MKNNLHTVIPAEIILGTPSIGCKGHGICKILTQSVASALPCPSVSALISMQSGKMLRIAFLKSTLSATVQKMHFGEGGFKVIETLELPKRLKTAFQIQGGAILPGLYPIIENDQCLFVDFNT